MDYYLDEELALVHRLQVHFRQRPVVQVRLQLLQLLREML
jgi:hypothetical protein